MSDLHIAIAARIDNQEMWDHDHRVPIPDNFTDRDIEGMVIHQLDVAVADHQRRHHGRARMVEIVEQYETRMRVIENIIRHAPRNLSAKGMGAMIDEVIHLDNDTLYERYERFSLGHD